MVFALVPPSAEEAAQWLQLLDAPSATAVDARNDVLARAEKLASAIPKRAQKKAPMVPAGGAATFFSDSHEAHTGRPWFSPRRAFAYPLLLVLAICKRGLLLEKCDKRKEEEEVRPIVPCPVCALVPVPVPHCELLLPAAHPSRSHRQSI